MMKKISIKKVEELSSGSFVYGIVFAILAMFFYNLIEIFTENIFLHFIITAPIIGSLGLGIIHTNRKYVKEEFKNLRGATNEIQNN